MPLLLRFILCGLLFSCLAVHAEKEQKVTLNFRKMDINVFIETIAEITGKTFIVDPRVKAEITVMSSPNKPLTEKQVYDIFLSILSVHGFTAVPSGDVVKIIPDNQAKSENSPVMTPHDTLQGDAYITQVVELKYVSASQLVPILRPLLPQQSHLVAYPANNTLVISDRADNVSRLLKIIQRVDQAHNEAVEVVVLEHAQAGEVARILTTLEQKNAAQATAGGNVETNSILADERTNSVLISGEPAARLRLRTLISHLDTPVKTVGNTKVIYLRYAKAKDLAEVLKGLTGVVTENRGNNDLQIVLPPAAPPGVPATAAPVPANTVPTGPSETVKTTIQADETTNSLVITAAPETMRNLETVIRQLDIRRAQVLVEAIIAEVAEDKARELGVQWILDGTPNGSGPVGLSNFTNISPTISNVATAVAQTRNGSTTTLPNVGAGLFMGLGRFGSDILNFAVLLKALVADSSTNVLSTPSLLTLDNQEAEIVVGQNVPFVTGQYTGTQSGSNNFTNPFQTIQRQDIGLKLKVKPQINEGNSVKLDIEQEVSSIAATATGFSDVVTNKRTIKTTVIVEDGNMVILGGLIDEDLQQTAQKVPGLGDLPFIGGLFRSQSTKKVKRNLMVFLHPTIVRDAQTENIISGSKYSQMRARQLEQKAQGLPLLSAEEIPILPDVKNFLIILPAGQGLLPPANESSQKLDTSKNLP